MNPLIRDYLSQSLVDPFAPPQRLEAPLVGERIRQRAVTSVLPLWKFYKRDNKYVIPYVIDESIGKCACVWLFSCLGLDLPFTSSSPGSW